MTIEIRFKSADRSRLAVFPSCAQTILTPISPREKFIPQQLSTAIAQSIFSDRDRWNTCLQPIVAIDRQVLHPDK